MGCACINDRDTLAFEMRNVDALKRIRFEPDEAKRRAALEELVLKAIGGRFERFPNRYYELRIKRLQAAGVRRCLVRFVRVRAINSTPAPGRGFVSQ